MAPLIGKLVESPNFPSVVSTVSILPYGPGSKLMFAVEMPLTLAGSCREHKPISGNSVDAANATVAALATAAADGSPQKFRKRQDPTCQTMLQQFQTFRDTPSVVQYTSMLMCQNASVSVYSCIRVTVYKSISTTMYLCATI